MGNKSSCECCFSLFLLFIIIHLLLLFSFPFSFYCLGNRFFTQFDVSNTSLNLSFSFWLLGNLILCCCSFSLFCLPLGMRTYFIKGERKKETIIEEQEEEHKIEETILETDITENRLNISKNS